MHLGSRLYKKLCTMYVVSMIFSGAVNDIIDQFSIGEKHWSYI